MLAESKERGVDDGIRELQGGDRPILTEAGAEGEDEHDKRAGDERPASEEAEEQKEADGGFCPGQDEAEVVDGPVGEGCFGELWDERGREVNSAGENADEAMEEDVEAEDEAQEEVAELPVLGWSHDSSQWWSSRAYQKRVGRP